MCGASYRCYCDVPLWEGRDIDVEVVLVVVEVVEEEVVEEVEEEEVEVLGLEEVEVEGKGEG